MWHLWYKRIAHDEHDGLLGYSGARIDNLRRQCPGCVLGVVAGSEIIGSERNLDGSGVNKNWIWYTGFSVSNSKTRIKFRINTDIERVENFCQEIVTIYVGQYKNLSTCFIYVAFCSNSFSCTLSDYSSSALIANSGISQYENEMAIDILLVLQPRIASDSFYQIKRKNSISNAKEIQFP